MGVQTLLPPIETAGHPFNSAALPHSLWYSQKLESFGYIIATEA